MYLLDGRFGPWFLLTSLVEWGVPGERHLPVYKGLTPKNGFQVGAVVEGNQWKREKHQDLLSSLEMGTDHEKNYSRRSTTQLG